MSQNNPASPELIDLLMKLEGLPGGGPALMPYLDSSGTPTDGYGNTSGVVMGQPITKEKAIADLQMYADAAVGIVDRLVTISLNDNERSALGSFVFNEGGAAFEDSTLLRMINKGDLAHVPDQMIRWTKFHAPDGTLQESSGLRARRAAEIALWLTPIFGTSPADQHNTYTSGPAVPPPNSSIVVQTNTGIAQVGVIMSTVAGAIVQGAGSLQPVSDATHQIVEITSSFPVAAHGILIALAVLTIAFSLWTMWDRNKKLKDGR